MHYPHGRVEFGLRKQSFSNWHINKSHLYNDFDSYNALGVNVVEYCILLYPFPDKKIRECVQLFNFGLFFILYNDFLIRTSFGFGEETPLQIYLYVFGHFNLEKTIY